MTNIAEYVAWAKQVGFNLIVTDAAPTTEAYPKGCLAVDKTNGQLYINSGTESSPSWSLFSKLGGSIGTSEIEDEAVTAAKLAATLDLSSKTVTLSETDKKSTQSSGNVNIVDDDSASSNGTPLFLELKAGGMEVDSPRLVTEDDDGSFETSNNAWEIPVGYVARAVDQNVNVTDDDSAASNGVAVYVRPLWGLEVGISTPQAGVAGRLEFVSPTNALGTFSANNGGDGFVIFDNDGAAAAALGVPTFQVYFDEDAANANSRFLINNTITGQDIYVKGTNGSYIKLKHDSSASSNGVAVYFDEDASNGYEKLLFVSPTNANGTATTDNLGGLEDIEGRLLKRLYLDESGDQLAYDSTETIEPLVRAYNKSNLGDRYLRIHPDASADTYAPVFFNSGAANPEDGLIATAVDNTDHTAPLSDTERPNEITKLAS